MIFDSSKISFISGFRDVGCLCDVNLYLQALDLPPIDGVCN